MCLVFRTIVLLSLNWWVISVVAQEKQDVIITDTALSQASSTPQAQQPPQDKKEPVQGLVTTDTTKALTVVPLESLESLLATDTTEQVIPVIAVVPVKVEPLAITDTPQKFTEEEPESLVTTDTSKLLAETQPASLVATDTTKQIVPVIPVISVKAESLVTTDTTKTSTEKKAEPLVVDEVLSVMEEEEEAEPEELEEAKEEKIAPKTMPDEEADIKGIDTVDLDEPRGNWLFKKIWWGRAENKYEKIRAVFENVLESRILFFTKRSIADKDLFAPFYFEIGMDNGELQAIVSQLMNYIEKERKKEGNLSPAGREIFNVLLSEKKSLESINADVLAVNKLDMDIDETLKKLMEQIDLARKYEREAWRNFKDIGRVLSDKKARELYYQMDTAYNNIKDIQEYVGQALIVHLDRVVGTAKNQTERIKASIDTLNKKGHDLRTLADKISGNLQKKPLPAEQAEEEQESEEEEEQGFFAKTFSSIKSGFVAVWDSIVYVITLPLSWFSGEASEQEPVEEESA